LFIVFKQSNWIDWIAKRVLSIITDFVLNKTNELKGLWRNSRNIETAGQTTSNRLNGRQARVFHVTVWFQQIDNLGPGRTGVPTERTAVSCIDHGQQKQIPNPCHGGRKKDNKNEQNCHTNLFKQIHRSLRRDIDVFVLRMRWTIHGVDCGSNANKVNRV
jgi:hypothetical protein